MFPQDIGPSQNLLKAKEKKKKKKRMKKRKNK